MTKEKVIVKAGASMTLNLGNYESARVEAGIELPVFMEDVPKEFERAWAEVERQLTIKISEIKASRNEPK